ncbi:YihD family protein [Vibrio sp.]|uniref:YihD family protein n=1 Tax=Vibrio sp. TaxID=678 RepID=UPI003D0F21A8
MKCHRIEELLELLEPEWHKEQQLNLVQFIRLLADEAGYQGDLEQLTDDVLIYHLKMRNSGKDEMIPGLKKDQEEDFKTAILRARGIID